MTTTIFLATGHGYETGSQGRCNAFDDYTVIAAPCPRREERMGGAFRCDYGSHSIKLARRTSDMTDRRTGAPITASDGLYILMQHGGGREVLRIPAFYDNGGEMLAAWLAMPERALYATLYTIYEAASNARDVARDAERSTWTQAHVDKRIRQRTYRSRGTAKVWIEPKRQPDDTDEMFEARKAWAAPSKA